MKIDLPSFVHGGTSAKVSDVAHRPFVQVNSNLQNILAYQVYIFNNQVIFYLSVTMFVCFGFFVPLENFSLIWRYDKFVKSQ